MDPYFFVWPIMTDHLEQFFEDYPARLDAADVATILGVTQQVVYQWLKKGIIPGYKVGSSWLILRDELRDMMRASSNSRTATAGESDN